MKNNRQIHIFKSSEEEDGRGESVTSNIIQCVWCVIVHNGTVSIVQSISIHFHLTWDHFSIVPSVCYQAPWGQVRLNRGLNHGWMDGRMNGRMDRWIDEWSPEPILSAWNHLKTGIHAEWPTEQAISFLTDPVIATCPVPLPSLWSHTTHVQPRGRAHHLMAGSPLGKTCDFNGTLLHKLLWPVMNPIRKHTSRLVWRLGEKQGDKADWQTETAVSRVAGRLNDQMDSAHQIKRVRSIGRHTKFKTKGQTWFSSQTFLFLFYNKHD